MRPSNHQPRRSKLFSALTVKRGMILWVVILYLAYFGIASFSAKSETQTSAPFILKTTHKVDELETPTIKNEDLIPQETILPSKKAHPMPSFKPVSTTYPDSNLMELSAVNPQYVFTAEQKIIDDSSNWLNASIKHEIERYTNWLGRFAVNGTVLIMSTNHGYQSFMYNQLCSMDNVDPSLRSTVVVWAMDELIFNELRNSKQYTFQVFFDPELTGSTTRNRGGDDSFNKLMAIRPDFFTNLARTQLNVLFMDADIVWFDNVWKRMFNDRIINANLDWIFTTDYRNLVNRTDATRYYPSICAGFFWLKPSPWFIQAFNRVLRILVVEKRYNGNDQMALQEALNAQHASFIETGENWFNENNNSTKTPRIALLPQVPFINGFIYRNRRKTYCDNLKKQVKMGIRRASVHGNWWWTDKLADFRNEPDIWFLEKDERTCKPYRDPENFEFACPEGVKDITPTDQ